MATLNIKVKNGKLLLPQPIRAQWKNAEIAIREYGANRMVLERITPEKKEQALKAFRDAAGILKGKISNPVKWQRKIRKEWERKLPPLRVHH